MEKELKKLYFLIIEDDDDDFFLLKTYLNGIKSYEFQIDRTETLSSAVTQLEKENYNLILSDLTLPDSDDNNTIEQVLKFSKNIPLIVLTGQSDTALISKFLKKGIQDYLIKGFIDSTLLEKAIYYSIERSKLMGNLKSLNERLKEISSLDPLTNIYNRRGLEIALVNNYKTSGNICSLLIDLDNFKTINDTHGHSAGDIVLKEVANVLSVAARTTDIVSRIGGDEFVVCLNNVNSKTAYNIAEKIRNKIAAIKIKTFEIDLQITASIGIVSIPSKDITVDKIVRSAQTALKKSKLEGKNCVVFEENDKFFKTISNLNNSSELKLFDISSTGKYLYSVSQPLFNIESNEIIGYEYFIRSSVKGISKPTELFNSSFDIQLLTQIDFFSFTKCLEKSKSIGKTGISHFFNILPSTLISFGGENLLSLLNEHSVDNCEYCLEISEQQLMGHPKHLLEITDYLKSKGVKIALDDVGFGQTCLENLIVLEPDIVKIDMSCIKGVGSKSELQSNIKKIFKVLQALEIEKIIAEGVENEKDFAFLKDISIKYGQGFLLGKPVE